MCSYKKVSLLFLFVLGLVKLNIYAQSALPALPMLYINPSPRINALGMAGASLPTNDPFGFYYNPAQLGYFSQTNNLSYELYPSNEDWLGLGVWPYRNSAVNIGYNFKNELNGLSLSAGFGYIHSESNLGTYMFYPGYTSSIYDKYDAYSLGIGVDYYVQFNIGFTYKSINSSLGVWQIPGTSQYKNAQVSPTAVDYGVLMTVPVLKLTAPEYKFNLLNEIPAVPYFNISLGYSRLNQGGEVAYVDPAQSDPMPRTARLGYAISTGLDIEIHNNKFRLFGYDFTVDADEMLISRDTSFNLSYKSGIGNISIGRNLIGLKSSDNVVVHKAHEFNLCETFTVMIGRFDGAGYFNNESNGIGMRLKGILTLLKAYTTNETFNFIADHMDVQYYSSKINFGWTESKFESINISFYNFML